MEEDVWKKAKSNAANVMQNGGWVQWIHEGTGFATTQAERDLRIVWEALSGKKHCAVCMNLSGCCFPRNNMPEYPLHPNCHCKTEPIGAITATARCRESKVEGWIFNPLVPSGKKELFYEWGYSIIDKDWLISEYIRQGKEKYERGDFTLHKLNEYGQQINIIIELPRKDRIGTVTFTSGWMVYPNGVIELVTGFGRR